MSKHMHDLYTQLPDSFVPNSNITDTKRFIYTTLEKDLPSMDHKLIPQEMQRLFYLDKNPSYKKQQTQNKRVRRKKTFLKRKERKELGLLKLPKDQQTNNDTKWNYKSLEPLRIMWRQYMRENLDLIEKNQPINYYDNDWSVFSIILSKSELIGAELTVLKSKNVQQIGVRGTVILETKMTFQIVTPKSELKILLKSSSIFQFHFNKFNFTVFGKHLLTKPVDKNTKKFKQYQLPDL